MATKTSTTPEVTKTFSTATLKGEKTRRKLNKTRKPAVRAKSWVLPALSGEQIDKILAGEPQEVEFKSGRREIVGVS